jgi:hypothetical protein
MRRIAELNVLLRKPIELPAGLKLATEEFQEDWNFVRAGDALSLGKKIQKQRWNFIKDADGSMRCGVGDTSQTAIAGALKLTLRHVDARFNAVEVEKIQITQYPWFFLARVLVYPYRIQEDAVSQAADETLQMALEQRYLSSNAPELLSRFQSKMPLLRDMLVSTPLSEGGMQ